MQSRRGLAMRTMPVRPSVKLVICDKTKVVSSFYHIKDQITLVL